MGIRESTESLPLVFVMFAKMEDGYSVKHIKRIVLSDECGQPGEVN